MQKHTHTNQHKQTQTPPKTLICEDFLPREGTVAPRWHPEGMAVCGEFGESLRKQRSVYLIIFISIIPQHA